MNKMLALLIVLCWGCRSSADTSWRELFNGEDLSGWSVIQGEAPFQVESGEIVGTAVAGSPNTFLRTEDTYTDFILEFEVMVDPALNSGVQFRSRSQPTYREGVVHGYQVEIDPSERAWSGGIYEEQGRGWLAALDEHPEGRKAFKGSEWNRYRVEAIGHRVSTWVNGVPTAHLLDSMGELSGFIALQVHSLSDISQAGKRVRWRNIRLLRAEPGVHLRNNPLPLKVIESESNE